MIKRFFLLTIVGTLVYFVFGWVVFDLILGSYTEENTTQLHGFKKNAEQFSITYLVLSCAAYSALIVYVITFLAKTKSIIKGTYIASIIGLLVAIMTNSYWYASSNYYNNVLVAIVDVIAAIITVGFLGLVVTFLSSYFGE